MRRELAIPQPRNDKPPPAFDHDGARRDLGRACWTDLPDASPTDHHRLIGQLSPARGIDDGDVGDGRELQGDCKWGKHWHKQEGENSSMSRWKFSPPDPPARALSLEAYLKAAHLRSAVAIETLDVPAVAAKVESAPGGHLIHAGEFDTHIVVAVLCPSATQLQ